MKKKIIQTLSCMLVLLAFSSLRHKSLIEVQHFGGFGWSRNRSPTFYFFEASSEADQIVAQIVGAVGLSKNFVVKSADCKTALAAMKGNQRYILYNNSFLEDFKKDSKTRLAAYLILIHEIGHHLNGHNFETDDPRKRKKMELEVDRFAGSALFMLGATLDETEEAIDEIQYLGESNSHPPVRARVEAIGNGWKITREHQYSPNSKKSENTGIDKKTNNQGSSEHPLTSPTTSTATTSDLNFEAAAFPFPPPSCYTLYELTNNHFDNCRILGDVSQQITKSLDDYRYPYRFMSVPGGFAIVTQIEQYEEDGKIKTGVNRWQDYPTQASFSFSMDYFKSLIYPNKCYLRVFAFIVTTQSFRTDEKRVSKQEASDWLSQGVNKLPKEVMRMPFSDKYSVSALVYEFEVPESNYDVRQNCPCHHPAFTHLEQTGLGPAIMSNKKSKISNRGLTLVGNWQMSFHNDNGQHVVAQNMILNDGTIHEETFIDGILNRTAFYTWRLENNVLTIIDQYGFYYKYLLAFAGTNTIIMTFTESNGQAAVSVGTQFTYHRI